jgi:formate dehydrogenase subunit beta
MPVTEGPNAAVRRLLAALLESGAVGAVLVPMAQPRGGHLTHALVSDPALLSRAWPLAPAMPVNAARLVAQLSSQPPDAPIAAVLRPCEERALVELVKLRQASLERIYPVVFDCPGACTESELARLAEAPDGIDGATAMVLAAAHEPEAPGPELRAGCTICDRFGPGPVADVALELFGHPDWIGVGLSDRLAGAIDLEALGLEHAGDDGDTAVTSAKLLQVRSRARERALERLDAMRAEGVEGLLEAISGCVRCGNCQRACPICFCRRCTFETQTFEHEPEHYLGLARRLGATRMPGDALLFHLTRLAHVALSCASCGACEAACPRGIELTGLFVHVGRRVRGPFDYEPGRSLEEELPLATFEREELEPR